MKTFKMSLFVGVIAFLAGRFLTKPKEITKETVKYITVEVEKKETKKKTKIIEIKNPDGRTETETEIVEDSRSERRSDTEMESSKVAKRGGSISVGLLALKDLGEFSEQTHIGTVVSVPFIGALKVTSYVDSTKRVGLGLSLEF
jgi:hypothetical protein